MDHEVVPRPCKICNWLLKSSWGHCGLHQGDNVKVTVEFKVPQRHILRPTLSIGMVQRVLRWGRQNKPMAKKCYYDSIFLRIFLGEEKMKTREDKRMVKLELFFFQNCPFWAYTKKTPKSLFGAWSSWSTFSLHLVRGPKAL